MRVDDMSTAISTHEKVSQSYETLLTEITDGVVDASAASMALRLQSVTCNCTQGGG